jgi:hypothetical protein
MAGKVNNAVSFDGENDYVRARAQEKMGLVSGCCSLKVMLILSFSSNVLVSLPVLPYLLPS